MMRLLQQWRSPWCSPGGLADSLGIPESLHDLAISLSNLAGVVERLGDAERAESLRAERDRIAEILGNRSSET